MKLFRNEANRRLFAVMATPRSMKFLATVLTLLVATACDIHTVDGPGALANLTVAPNVTLAVGSTQQFTASGEDAAGAVVLVSPVWTVVAGGGTINATGFFTAGMTVGVFPATVKATSDGMSGTANVTVIGLAAPAGPPLGAAASHGILAGTAVTCINTGFIDADIGVSPGNTLTGFGPCTRSGVLNLANAVSAQAQLDLTSAYNALAGLPCPPANLISADLGGTTKAAGVYCSAIGIGVTGVLTLNGGGDPNATFVFQAGSSLITAGNVVLINGAQSRNVFWKVGSSATLGSGSQWKGNILALSSITLVDGANLIGRALARNGAVSLGTTNTITLP